MSSSSLLTKGLQSSYSQQKLLPYNVVQVYNCVNDISKYSEYIPGIKRARIISSSNISENPTLDARSSTNAFPTITFAELQIDIIAIQLRYMSQVISIPYRSIEAFLAIF